MNRVVQSVLLAWLLAWPAAGADWKNYSDDFSSNHVETDSSLHSSFYETAVNPLPEPYLMYHGTGASRGLVFMAFGDQPAALGYCLSYDAAQTRRMIAGTFTLTVSFPCDDAVSLASSGELSYATSTDGLAWSQNQSLWPGQQSIPIRSTEGKYYILFTGDRAKIDNVRVTLSLVSATLRVPGNYATIQQALDAAKNGDVVEVASGDYAGPGNWDLDFGGKRIILRSINGPQSTRILGGDGHRGLHFHKGETSDSVVSGFTIKGARLSGSTTLGGGVYCEGASPRFVNCIVEDCVAGLGGGVACVGGEPVFTRCTIQNCSATSAGSGVYLFETAATLAGCTISGNVPSGAGSVQGGGVYCLGDAMDVTIRNCVISENTASAGAGVLAEPFSVSGPRCRVSIVNCTIVQNRLTSAGLAAVDAAGAEMSILNSIIWGNDGAGVTPSYGVDVSYCNIQGGYSGWGNLSVTPQFADSGFHLSAKSPCIDAGDPSSSAAAEPSPNGAKIDLGAYGGTVEATPGVAHTTYHVNVKTGRDSYDGRSLTRAYATIQAAIDAAADGDTILVWPGVYHEEITFEGKAITVRSAADAAVLTSPDGYACSFYMGETADSVLMNFVITGCGKSGVFCSGASPTLKNLTIVKNQAGVLAYGGAQPAIVNCILWSNTNPVNGKSVSLEAWMGGYAWNASYSCIDTGAADNIDWSAGNIKMDPLFADFKNGDYHLQSRYGRYVPSSGTWAFDSATSPCIDGGDPFNDPSTEPADNGGLVNMGAYGGTRYASRSGVGPCP